MNSINKNTIDKFNLRYFSSFTPDHLTSRIKSVSASKYFSCAIDYNDALFCWWNAKYNPDKKSMPIEGFETQTTRMKTGIFSVCAENHSKEFKCFSNNKVNGGEFTYQLEMPNGFDFDLLDYSIGVNFMCAIKKDNTLNCWDYQYYYLKLDPSKGQYIEIVNFDLYTPIQYAKSVTVSYAIACAISKNDKLYCWNLNNYQSLNFRDSTNKYSMAQVSMHYFCAIDLDKKLHCWTSYGKSFDIHDRMKNDNIAISMKVEHLCAIKSEQSHKMYCWDLQDKVESPDFDNVNSISAGKNHDCAIIEDTKLECFDQTLGKMNLDVSEEILMGTKAAETGYMYNLAIDSMGKLRIEWVYPVKGKSLNDDSNEYSNGSISAGRHSFCAITSDRNLNCWIIISDRVMKLKKAPIPDLLKRQGVIQVSVGSGNHCVVTTKNGIICWIYMNYLRNDYVPNELMLANDVRLVAVSLIHRCAALTSRIFCWGRNYPDFIINETAKDLKVSYKKLCYVTNQDALKCHIFEGQKENPVIREMDVPEKYQRNTRSISVHINYICKIDTFGILSCWYDHGGEAYVPYEVRSNAVSVSSTYTHTCSRSTVGKLTCWQIDDAE